MIFCFLPPESPSARRENLLYYRLIITRGEYGNIESAALGNYDDFDRDGSRHAWVVCGDDFINAKSAANTSRL